VLKTILAVAGTFADVQFVFAVGASLELLKRAALCITHAGLNTTLVAQGVPLVAIPIARTRGLDVADDVIEQAFGKNHSRN
jgi:UDP:flavonoid glycosyltransferase YjiC (YdhE family)